jgi:putative flavoprotein involved in K+ transport
MAPEGERAMQGGGRHEALVVGAGPAGLAAAAMLRARGVEAAVVEQASVVGAAWHDHYDRLHLHTTRSLSALPGLRIPRGEGRWVPRDGVVRYLERYASHHAVPVRFGVRVGRLDPANGGWRAETSAGPLFARWVVVATGYNREPRIPEWPGRESFTGELVHSSAYRNPSPYRGKDVLVVGTGNSGAEIAVDLAEGGAGTVSLAVRTPPSILPRQLLGMPTQAVGLLVRRLPVRIVDGLARLTQRVFIGNLTSHGLPPPPRGLYTRLVEDDVLPILDVGLVRMLRAGRVRVVPAVERFEGSHVVLAEGGRVAPHAVIAATGFRRGLDDLVGHLRVLAPSGRPRFHGPVMTPGAPGLHFIGYTNPISGNIRELGIDARRIARAVAAEKGSRSWGLRERARRSRSLPA